MAARGSALGAGNGRRQPTATSAFGVSRRENHDSAAFYQRFPAPVLSDDDAVRSLPAADLDQIHLGDARDMGRIPSGSVALVVTSPPYFAGKQYEAELGQGGIPASYTEFLAMLEGVFAECVRVLEPGGRIAVNVANLGRKPYRSLSADVIGILQDRLGLLLRGEVVWRKARGAGGNCAWGSFRSPANPVLRDLTERVVVASKGRFDRALTARRRAAAGLPHEVTTTADEFMEATLDVWELAPERATLVGHPAPFPVELPQRFIELYTWRGDVVLDPFMGSGSAAVAAVRTGRHYLGYDTDPVYVSAARARAEEEARRVAAAGGPLAVSGPAAGLGDKAVEAAAALLAKAGFAVDPRGRRRPGGLEVPLVATDASGHEWLVDVVGGFTLARPGLRRSDVLERTLGRAARLSAFGEHRLLVLATDMPYAGSPGAAALRAARGRVYVDVLPIDLPEPTIDRLAAYATATSPPPESTPDDAPPPPAPGEGAPRPSPAAGPATAPPPAPSEGAPWPSPAAGPAAPPPPAPSEAAPLPSPAAGPATAPPPAPSEGALPAGASPPADGRGRAGNRRRGRTASGAATGAGAGPVVAPIGDLIAGG